MALRVAEEFAFAIAALLIQCFLYMKFKVSCSANLRQCILMGKSTWYLIDNGSLLSFCIHMNNFQNSHGLSIELWSSSKIKGVPILRASCFRNQKLYIGFKSDWGFCQCYSITSNWIFLVHECSGFNVLQIHLGNSACCLINIGIILFLQFANLKVIYFWWCGVSQ